MADDKKAPRARVESGAPDEVVDVDAHVIDEGKKGQDASEGSTSQAFKDGAARVNGWVSRAFPGHENAFWGGVLGALLAVLIFWVGPVRALGVALLVIVGVAFGQVADGDPKIINLLRRFFTSNN